MKALPGINKILMPFLAVILILSCLVFLPSVHAVMALPNIGIDYQTMTVNDAAKLTAAGMRTARNGDRIGLSISKDKKLIFKNYRTNEELFFTTEKSAQRPRNSK